MLATRTEIPPPGPGSISQHMDQNESAVRPRDIGAEQRHLPGEEGIWIFIFGEMMIFTLLFGNFLIQRMRQPAVFMAGQTQLNQTDATVETLFLLISSLFVLLGLRGIRQRMTTAGPWLFAGAIACALGFCGMKAVEWQEKIAHGLTPGRDSFFTFYYVLTGLHLTHVVIGMAVLGFLLHRARQTEQPGRSMILIEGGACWWHMVDLIWMVLFPLLYLAR